MVQSLELNVVGWIEALEMKGENWEAWATGHNRAYLSQHDMDGETMERSIERTNERGQWSLVKKRHLCE